jgi:hypothetical protein
MRNLLQISTATFQTAEDGLQLTPPAASYPSRPQRVRSALAMGWRIFRQLVNCKLSL